MKIIKITFLFASFFTLINCASSYSIIAPKSINYVSSNENQGVKLEYKYELLDKKYKKREISRGTKLVAIKVTNNSDKDLVFGKDLKLFFENEKEVYIMDNDKAYKTLRQNVAPYLLYLLLTPVNLYQTTTNSYGQIEQKSIFPIGFVLGPGIAGGNMIGAASANKKFKEELLEYNVQNSVIKKGEIKFGLIAIKSESFESLKLKIE